MSDSQPPSDRFSEQERITANLRFRSLPAAQRTLLGLFAFVTPAWRGPLLLAALCIIGFLAYKLPALWSWVRGTP